VGTLGTNETAHAFKPAHQQGHINVTHFTTLVNIAHIGATVAALIIAIGASLGFYHMTGSLWTAVLAGVGIASLLGFGWWGLISLGSRARRLTVRILTVVLGITLVFVALGTSGWAIATAIGGKTALTDYQLENLSAYEEALAEAGGRIDRQHQAIRQVRIAEAGMRLLRDEEGLTGQGPNYRTFTRAQARLIDLANAMEDVLDESELRLKDGEAALERASTLLGTEEPFRLALAEVEGVVRAINTVDVSVQLNEVGVVTRDSDGLPKLTGLYQDLDREVGSLDFAPVEVPKYAPKTRSEAVLSGGAPGAWIAAVAIDAAPLLFLFMVMLASYEPLMREAKASKTKSNETIREEETDLERPVPREGDTDPERPVLHIHDTDPERPLEYGQVSELRNPPPRS